MMRGNVGDLPSRLGSLLFKSPGVSGPRRIEIPTLFLNCRFVVWATDFGRLPFLQANGTGPDLEPLTCYQNGLERQLTNVPGHRVPDALA
jgi:hypothetical protein